MGYGAYRAWVNGINSVNANTIALTKVQADTQELCNLG